jgi:hypothetical protein
VFLVLASARGCGGGTFLQPAEFGPIAADANYPSAKGDYDDHPLDGEYPGADGEYGHESRFGQSRT